VLQVSGFVAGSRSWSAVILGGKEIVTQSRTAPFEVEVVVDGQDEVGEGPIWHDSEHQLIWVDITRNLIHRLDPVTNHKESIDVGQPVGAVAPRATGGLIAAVRDGFGLISTTAERLEMLAEVEADNSGNRMNDGKCDSAGRFWAGTMAYDLTPRAGALYRLNTDHSVVKVLEEITLSNGLGWSPDDTSMYFVDSATNGVDVFDYEADSGEVRNRRRLIDIPQGLGMPDGMTLDAEGFIWVALWGGWSIRRYAPDGTPDLVIELPASQITSSAFGGKDLSELYITSAAYELPEHELRKQPHAGALFRCRPGTLGRPAHVFEG
jgi:sugar lactone lactonase YvrE